MIPELFDGVVSGIVRFIARVFTEIIVETLVRGAGYLFFRLCGIPADPDSTRVLILGIAIWLIIITSAYKLFF